VCSSASREETPSSSSDASTRALGSLSLGIASHAFAVRDAIAQGFKTYDLLRGDEPYKYDLGASDRWLWRLEATPA